MWLMLQSRKIPQKPGSTRKTGSGPSPNHSQKWRAVTLNTGIIRELACFVTCRPGQVSFAYRGHSLDTVGASAINFSKGELPNGPQDPRAARPRTESDRLSRGGARRSPLLSQASD